MVGSSRFFRRISVKTNDYLESRFNVNKHTQAATPGWLAMVGRAQTGVRIGKPLHVRQMAAAAVLCAYVRQMAAAAVLCALHF